MQERPQGRGGATEKDRKIAKKNKKTTKNSTIKPLSTISARVRKSTGGGGHARCRRPCLYGRLHDYYK